MAMRDDPILNLNLTQRYAQLGSQFYAEQPPKPLADPQLVVASESALALLGLTVAEAQTPAFLALTAGQWLPSNARPLAMVYAGHQFGGYSPRLGDGRGLLLGEIEHPAGEVWELHLKGAGLTPFSRMGDGRAVLRSSIREFLASEYLFALAIPTSRAATVTASATRVWREQQETAATLLRLAPSHIRFGHFEYFYYTRQLDELQQLLDFTIQQHFAECLAVDNPVAAFFSEVVVSTARLIAEWQAYGFCHGVMNTDNMSILGLTFDYGPYAFLEQYRPEYICNASDHQGRYRFSQQPAIAEWNLTALAETLTGHIPLATLRQELARFMPLQQEFYLQRMRQRLGWQGEQAQDSARIEQLLGLLAKTELDYSQFFRALSEQPAATYLADLQRQLAANLGFDVAGFSQWCDYYLQRTATVDEQQRQTQMQAVNPLYVLRNYLAQLAIEAAEQGDYQPTQQLHQILTQPFVQQANADAYAAPAPAWGRALSISCSS